MMIVYTFSNTHTVISAEQILLGAHVPVKVMPVPNAITAGCGLCLRVPPEYWETAETAMQSQLIASTAIYEMNEGKFKLLGSAED